MIGRREGRVRGKDKEMKDEDEGKRGGGEGGGRPLMET